jgi:hypothetical protein
MVLSTVCSFMFSMLLLIALFGDKAGGPGGLGMGQGIFYTLIGSIATLIAGFVFCIFFMALVATSVNNRPILGSIIGHAVFLMVSPWIFLGITFLALTSGAAAGGSRGPGGGGPEVTSTLALMMMMGAVIWFVVNVLTLSASVASARRRGQI